MTSSISDRTLLCWQNWLLAVVACYSSFVSLRRTGEKKPGTYLWLQPLSVDRAEKLCSQWTNVGFCTENHGIGHSGSKSNKVGPGQHHLHAA